MNILQVLVATSRLYVEFAIRIEDRRFDALLDTIMSLTCWDDLCVLLLDMPMASMASL